MNPRAKFTTGQFNLSSGFWNSCRDIRKIPGFWKYLKSVVARVSVAKSLFLGLVLLRKALKILRLLLGSRLEKSCGDVKYRSDCADRDPWLCVDTPAHDRSVIGGGH